MPKTSFKMKKTIYTNERKLDYRSKEYKNSVKIYPNNTVEHEMAKFLVCYNLLKEGWNFYTEAKFINGKRADIYIPELDWAIEIAHTETEKSKLKKQIDYPCEVFIFTTEELKNKNYKVV